MEGNRGNVIHALVRNYRLCLADFPTDLKSEHLHVPQGEQASLLEGLANLHALLGRIYDHFARLEPQGRRWLEPETCYRAIEDPFGLLWVMGTAGRLVHDADGPALEASRDNIDAAFKRRGVKDPAAAFGVLAALGFRLDWRDADGLPCPDGYRKFASVAMRYPADDSLLRALLYYLARLPEKKVGRKEKGIIFEVMLRADFRPLLPGYTFHMPHLPAEEEELARTLNPETLEVWKALTDTMTRRYPQYRMFFRVPFPRKCRWTADYSTREGDYGQYSIFTDEDGLQVRIVLIDGTVRNLLEHVGELSPDFQELYLNAVACKDCSHCGQHIFLTHGDHVHRICRSPWFHSPRLRLEDVPDIERLIDFRLAGLPPQFGGLQ